MFASARREFFLRALFLFFLASLTIYTANAQKYLEAFSSSLVDSANTAADVDYLTEQERLVYVYVNLVRMQPKQFLEKVVRPYLQVSGEQNDDVNSLLSDLAVLPSIPPVRFDKGLYESAKEHATVTGDKGLLGHSDTKGRLKKYAPQITGYGENISYGEEDAVDIVMQLLIDSGIESKGHRYNILDRDFTYMGVSIHTHTKYDFTCVQDFGMK
jgi:uncharacterized protein YkwD